jgi:hypothetical protein
MSSLVVRAWLCIEELYHTPQVYTASKVDGAPINHVRRPHMCIPVPVKKDLNFLPQFGQTFNAYYYIAS